MRRLGKVKEVLGTVAPSVARSLGGPLAGMAVKAVGDKLLGRTDASEGEIEAAILGALPGDLAKMRDAEAEFLRGLDEAGVEVERISAGDRASARERQLRMKDWTPAVLGGLIMVGFFLLLWVLMTQPLPADSADVVQILVGALAALMVQVANYFFGSSAGSTAKNGIIAELKGAR